MRSGDARGPRAPAGIGPAGARSRVCVRASALVPWSRGGGVAGRGLGEILGLRMSRVEPSSEDLKSLAGDLAIRQGGWDLQWARSKQDWEPGSPWAVDCKLIHTREKRTMGGSTR
ncbi:hypothetical protein E5288_WYG007120 [Bos mutus]|uniref:Uncharacterized protein n=1 Tax=Bos mutus TaxID=72004 RepID=A0A6B0QQH8_9CETA|nr:hypothetical protein [Bos mutus]